MFKIKQISMLFVAMAAMLVLFAGCGDKDDNDAGASSAKLAAETVNCFATTNKVETSGMQGLSFKAVITDQGSTQWCSFQLSAPLLEFSGQVGSSAFLYLQQNTTDQDRTAKIVVTFSDNYTTTLTLRQTKYSLSADYDQGWGEQPQYRSGGDYIYKTYHTTLSNGRYVRNYSICYDRRKHVSHWVAYPVVSIYTEGRDYPVGPRNTKGRTDAWAYDDSQTQYSASSPYYKLLGRTITQPEIPTSDQQYILSSYGAGSYQRGHMLASATRYNTWQTNAQTFYATNMMPQVGSFNGGTWGALEGFERGKMVSDTLFVVTGTLFNNSTTINNSNGPIAVPSHCWKVMLRTRSGSSKKYIGNCTADELMAIGFIFANSSANADVSIKSGACSVKEIERQTGFVFFRNLPPNITDQVKSDENFSAWGL